MGVINNLKSLVYSFNTYKLENQESDSSYDQILIMMLAILHSIDPAKF